VRGGEVQEVPALTPGGDERFPAPIGERRDRLTARGAAGDDAAQGRHPSGVALNCGGARGRCRRDEAR